MFRLRALLTARANPPDVKADGTLQLEFYSLVERELRAQLELQDISNKIREMRSMIANGVSAVRKPSFNTRLLVLYDGPRQREKLRGMIQNLEDRRDVLQKQVADWKKKEFPRWNKAIARIERRNARREQIERRGLREKSRTVPHGSPLVRGSSTRSRFELKIKIAELKSRDPKAPAREICRMLDDLIERGKKNLVPLEPWQKKADGKRTWIGLYDDKRTRFLVRIYINKVSPLVLS